VIGLQVLYYFGSAVLMAAAGSALLLPPLRSGAAERMYTGLILAFAAKMIIGVAAMVLAWKVLHWSPRGVTIGMVTAYLAALAATTTAALVTIQRGRS